MGKFQGLKFNKIRSGPTDLQLYILQPRRTNLSQTDFRTFIFIKKECNKLKINRILSKRERIVGEQTGPANSS